MRQTTPHLRLQLVDGPLIDHPLAGTIVTAATRTALEAVLAGKLGGGEPSARCAACPTVVGMVTDDGDGTRRWRSLAVVENGHAAWLLCEDCFARMTGEAAQQRIAL